MKQFTLVVLGLFLMANTYANNIHLIQEDPASGFAIYRTSKPSAKDMRMFCEKGIEEMMVLSGNAEKYEFKNQEHCPTLKVIYNTKQKAKIPLTASFLDFFDSWVEDAKRTGKKIAFRCSCGCHRTGRLAAYYQMKYQGLTSKDAKILMKKHGKWMFLHRQLWPQVTSLENYIREEECSVAPKHCVDTEN